MFKNIVLPINLSDTSSFSVILPVALNIASTFQSDIHLINVIPDFGMKIVEDYLPKNWINDHTAKNLAELDNLISEYIPSEISGVSYVARGSVYEEIIKYSNKIKADLIIISATSAGLTNEMLGHNTSSIVKYADISVLVVR